MQFPIYSVIFFVIIIRINGKSFLYSNSYKTKQAAEIPLPPEAKDSWKIIEIHVFALYKNFVKRQSSLKPCLFKISRPYTIILSKTQNLLSNLRKIPEILKFIPQTTKYPIIQWYRFGKMVKHYKTCRKHTFFHA